jgi:hypothetical protein
MKVIDWHSVQSDIAMPFFDADTQVSAFLGKI